MLVPFEIFSCSHKIIACIVLFFKRRVYIYQTFSFMLKNRLHNIITVVNTVIIVVVIIIMSSAGGGV